MAGGKIECYLDIASLYSYVMFVQILKTQDALRAHGVEIDIHPFFLGAVNAGSGNRPPWLVKTKARYLGKYETPRSLKAVGLENVSPPGNLMEMGRTILPLRALHYIKAHYPQSVYYTTFHYLFHAFWTQHRAPITPESLAQALQEVPVPVPVPTTNATTSTTTTSTSTTIPTTTTTTIPTTDRRRLLFDAAQTKQILEAAGSPEYKDRLRCAVEEALDRGAFGAPWLWVTDNAGGRSEPFFGSDRWQHVYEFFGLPYEGLRLLLPDQPSTATAKL
ncbi:thioredoxin-like protein [Xylariomycetidae sp. FL2044]|nr:thioredoxin-like protein [Xylariomycetidae sp. FL2044]